VRFPARFEEETVDAAALDKVVVADFNLPYEVAQESEKQSLVDCLERSDFLRDQLVAEFISRQHKK
jgi:hypothetical protein